MFWLLIALLPIIGLLLGVFYPHSNTIIELGHGSQFELLDEADSRESSGSGYLDALATRLPESAFNPDAETDLPFAGDTSPALHRKGLWARVQADWRPDGWRDL